MDELNTNVSMEHINDTQIDIQSYEGLIANKRPFVHNNMSYISVFNKTTKTWEGVPVTNAGEKGVLTKDQWKELDDAVVNVAEERLVGVNDLKSRGLVKNINGYESTVYGYTQVSDALEAEINMNGNTRAKDDTQVQTNEYVPLFITHADFSIDDRILKQSMKNGNRGLDTALAERAARKVADASEGMLFGSTIPKYANSSLYGYLTAPHRETGTSSDWADGATTGATIVSEVLAMKQKSINKKQYGPWVLYVPTGYETKLDADYDTTTPGTTIRERILKIEGISDVKVIDRLPADNILLVQMNSSTVRWINGLPLQTIQWSSNGMMTHNFKVLTIQVPQIMTDYNGSVGIVHYKPSE